jgi:hypothetical protein
MRICANEPTRSNPKPFRAVSADILPQLSMAVQPDLFK